jgi:hypothetical protein
MDQGSTDDQGAVCKELIAGADTYFSEITT